LTPITPATASTGSSPLGVTVDPSSRFAYVPNAYDPNNTVTQYTLDSVAGLLTPNGEVTAGNQPTSVAVNPSSNAAYVVNRADSTVSEYGIDSSGNLVLKNKIATGQEPFRVALDPSGGFAHVANETGSVSIYAINSNGSLTSAGTAITTGRPYRWL
jgi:6-phosphogluconolactonase